MMDLTKGQYTELVRQALNDRKGWIPVRAISGAKLYPDSYGRGNDLVELERAGLVTLTMDAKQRHYTVALTNAGKAAIRAMPDDLHTDWYPLPQDIAKAKARVSR